MGGSLQQAVEKRFCLGKDCQMFTKRIWLSSLPRVPITLANEWNDFYPFPSHYMLLRARVTRRGIFA